MDTQTTQLRGVSALRLSVLTDETTSPERQRDANRRAAAALGFDLADREAVDLGVSASKTTPFQRSGLGAWLKRPDDFDALFFWRFDRAVRRMEDMHELAKWAREHRKVIVFAEGPGGRLVLDFRNPLDPMAELMVTLFAFAAQMEAQAIKERVNGAMAAIRMMPLRWRGSRPPYGYISVPLEGGGSTLVLDTEPDEKTGPAPVAVIERIIRDLKAGKMLNAIAMELNGEGIPCPRDYWNLKKGRKPGGKSGGQGESFDKERFLWKGGMIRELLTSERLLGWKMHNNKPVRDSEGRPVLASTEQVLTREEFDGIAKLLEETKKEVWRNSTWERRDTNALLTRVAKCEGCGQNMHRHRRSAGSKSTSKTSTYRCGAHMNGIKCPRPATLKMEWCEEYAEREFLRIAGSIQVKKVVETPGYDPAPEIAATLAEFEEHQRQEGRQKSNAARQAWQKRADALDARLAELEARPKIEPRREVIETGRTYADEWHEADTRGKRQMLRDAGAVLVVRRAKSRGGWRYLDESRVSFYMTGDIDPSVEELTAIERVETVELSAAA
ncbi:recombinase family protein [Streptomyces aidingensis]|nr:recombinase family protein [Streptomyces aidingensis]